MTIKPFLSVQIFVFVMSASWFALVFYAAVVDMIEGRDGH